METFAWWTFVGSIAAILLGMTGLTGAATAYFIVVGGAFLMVSLALYTSSYYSTPVS